MLLPNRGLLLAQPSFRNTLSRSKLLKRVCKTCPTYRPPTSHHQKVDTIPRTVGHAPLLLGLQLANQNNNESTLAMNAAAFAAAGTTVVHEHIAEVKIPEETTSRFVGHVPALLGLQLANQNNNNASQDMNAAAIKKENAAAVPAVGTTVVHEHIVEVKLPEETTSRIVGHAPVLLGLQLANQSNTNTIQDMNAAAMEKEKKKAAVGTTVIHEHIVEVKLPGVSKTHDDKNQTAATPRTVGTIGQITEVVRSKLMHLYHSKYAYQKQRVKDTSIPGTVGILAQNTEVNHSKLAHQNQKDKSAAIPGTVGAFSKATEVDPRQDKYHGWNDVGILRLRGEYLPRSLTPTHCESYKKDGYLVIPDAITSSEADNLLTTAHNIMKRVSEGGEGIIRHEIVGDGANTPSPVGRILATFEPEDKSAPSPFHRRISRLGCSMHKLSPYHNLIHSPHVRSLLHSLNYADPRITQSQIIAKLAGIGGEIVPHQDGCVSFTNPPSCITFWYALDDANVGNGCLCVAEGSHLMEPLRQRLVKDKNGQPKFEDLETPVWAQGAKVELSEGGEKKGEERKHEYKALEVKKGTLILFHGNLLHKSGINLSGKNRIAYNFNVIEGEGDGEEDAYLKPEEGGYERL